MFDKVNAQMSRIGKRVLTVPAEVQVTIDRRFQKVVIDGPLGQIKYHFKGLIAIKTVDQTLITTPLKRTKLALMLHGTINSLLQNALWGVKKHFQKILIIEGLGYKFKLVSPTLVLEIGFSHPVKILIPADLELTLKKDRQLTISGVDKQRVGLFASQIRKLRPCEPYKGKGIRYLTEQIQRKLGKKSTK